MKLDLYGWFPPQNEKVLGQLIKDYGIKGVIEIGCFLGKSTSFFVSQGCRVFSIDTFEGASDLNGVAEVQKRLPTLYEQFLFNLKELGIEKEVVVYKGTSEQARLEHKTIKADMVFIDGSHEYEDVKKDIELWLSGAKKIICGDDYNKDHEGVMRAVDEMLPDAIKTERIWYKII